jgi:hypothetical protein
MEIQLKSIIFPCRLSYEIIFWRSISRGQLLVLHIPADQPPIPEITLVAELFTTTSSATKNVALRKWFII